MLMQLVVTPLLNKMVPVYYPIQFVSKFESELIVFWHIVKIEEKVWWDT